MKRNSLIQIYDGIGGAQSEWRRASSPTFTHTFWYALAGLNFIEKKSEGCD
jgi:hypothetical protein